jgi:lysophospholipase L1-like esterase
MSITPSTPTTPGMVLRAARTHMAPALRHSGALGMAGVGGILGAGVMFVELQQARRAIPEHTEPPFADGDFGPPDGRPLRLVLIGDSSAAGVGCQTSEQTPGALMAQELVDRGFRVHLDVIAVSGARSVDLAPQVARALLSPTDIAVICIGANDVTHFIAADVAAPLLGAAVLRLRDAGVAVLVATCPDLGAVRPVPQPMRQVGHHLCRRMSRLQAREVVLAGGVPVDIGRALGRAFRQGEDLFCQDRFHPSPRGYRALVDALVGPLDTLLPR